MLLPGWQCWLQWWIPGWWGPYTFPDDLTLNSISAAIFLFHLVRRFWNQILICVSVSLRDFESSVRREMVKYLLLRNSPSSSLTCVVVKAVLLRFFDGSRHLRRSLELLSCCITGKEEWFNLAFAGTFRLTCRWEILSLTFLQEAAFRCLFSFS